MFNLNGWQRLARNDEASSCVIRHCEDRRDEAIHWKTRLLTFFFIGLISLPCLAEKIAVTYQEIPEVLEYIGTLTPSVVHEVRAAVEGTVENIHIPWGREVEAGAPLLDIDAPKVALQLREAKAALLRAEEEYHTIVHWEEGAPYVQARAELTEAENAALRAKARYQETEKLYQKGLVSRDEWRHDEMQRDSAIRTLERAERNFNEVAKRGGEPYRSIAEMAYENAQVRAANLEAQYHARNIFAPVAGKVVRPPQEDNEKPPLRPGHPVVIDQWLCSIITSDALGARLEITENDVLKLDATVPVGITPLADPSVTWNATITEIGDLPLEASKHQEPRYGVWVASQEKSPLTLRPGMRAKVSFMLPTFRKALTLPLAAVCVGKSGKEAFVRKYRGTESSIKVPVQLGAKVGDSVEIVSGLKAGEWVESLSNARTCE